MNIYKGIPIGFAIIIILIISESAYSGTTNDYTKYVNPFIGTDFRGNTYPGATVPFGMIQLSPDTYTTGDVTSGYRHDAKSIIGFSHTHLSGTGFGDMLDLLIMPTNGKLHINAGKEHNPDTGYRSRFSHKNESASPGYYSVILDDYNTKAELTATERAGLHRYTFPKSDSIHIILDLDHRFHNSGKLSEVLDAKFHIVNDSLITGFRRIAGLAPNRYFYFAAKISRPIQSYGMAINDQLFYNQTQSIGKNLKCILNFSTTVNEQILIKVGISAVSTENALKNLDSELPGWDFDMVKKNAESKWNNELEKINAEFINHDSKVTFYTAMYHSMLAPVYYSDVNDAYRGSDFHIYTTNNFQNYHIFSLWETFRAVHPLFTIIQQERVNDIIQSMLAIGDESGFLPVWHLAANETNLRSGFHAIPVIVDAYLKGFEGFEVQKAYRLVKRSAQTTFNPKIYKPSELQMLDQIDQMVSLSLYRENGYVPFDVSNHSVSRTLEFAYNDWCISQMANSLGYTDDFIQFRKSAQNYKNIYDSTSGLMRGKSSAGEWRQPFDPFEIINHWQMGDYAGANAWQNLWFVPHDIPGLIDIMGGEAAFDVKLDFLFNPKAQQRVIAEDVAGFVGQYAQGNEPGHHTAYLFNYVGQPWKTQAIVRWILTRLYTNSPAGLTGNDDCGQMSAWYIFGVLGFYPVNPCGGIYVFGSPWVNEAAINLPHGKQFQILTKNQSMDNKYIQAVSLNGQSYDKLWISHSDIMNGGTLIFTMGDQPNNGWINSDLGIPAFDRNCKLNGSR